MIKKNKPEVPHLINAEKEFLKCLKRYWYSREDNEENKNLLYLMLMNFNKFIEEHILELGQKIFLDMEKKEEFINYVSEFGKKIFYDIEAEWLFIEDMNTDDYAITTKRDNIKFLNKEE
jgi:hypothetical protein